MSQIKGTSEEGGHHWQIKLKYLFEQTNFNLRGGTVHQDFKFKFEFKKISKISFKNFLIYFSKIFKKI